MDQSEPSISRLMDGCSISICNTVRSVRIKRSVFTSHLLMMMVVVVVVVVVGRGGDSSVVRGPDS